MSNFTNSPLVAHTRITPNRNSPRNQPIRKITIHHTAGVIGIENLGSWFSNPTCKGSSNYGVGSDGRVGMYVEEKDRAWTSSSGANDHQAITIEVSNSATGGEWPVSDRAFAGLIDLCVDLCKRNPGITQKDGKPGIYFDGTPNGSLTHHQMFAATSCPGAYLLARFQQICDEVNKRLNAAATPPAAAAEQPTPAADKTPIVAVAVATAAQMRAYIQRINPNAPDIADLFISEGEIEGIRGDIAFAQSCLETGNFMFTGGTAVTPDQNNFCGMGVTSLGVKGASFPTPQMGIRAQIHHLKAYANTEPLKNENQSPRFHLVKRGVAPYVEWLGVQENPEGRGWATGAGYGEKILRILAAITAPNAHTAASPAQPTANPSAPAQPNPAPFEPYLVRVQSGASIYRGAGSDTGTNGSINSGVYTIVEEADGEGAKKWGRLKSGAGWINLANAAKIEPTSTAPALKPLDEIAREVINGRWGNGQDRKNRLTAAGYDAAAVQARVNQLLK